MEGYFRRIWGKWGIERVASLKRGIYIVRFHTLENRKKTMEDGVQMFDKKPLIVQAWNAKLELRKTEVVNVPIWVKFQALELMYWGQASLMKIVGII